VSRNLRAILLAILALAVCILLQSTLLGFVAIRKVKPDLSLIVLVFVAMRRGSMVGQISGFASGFLEDFMNHSPLGFHSLIKTLIGFLYGALSGNMLIDPFIMPIVLTIVATLLKGFLAGVTSVLFGIDSVGFQGFTGPLWIEAAYNGIIAPALFALLNLAKPFAQADKEAA
jgi:rod shape-determining protein MreD